MSSERADGRGLPRAEAGSRGDEPTAELNLTEREAPRDIGERVTPTVAYESFSPMKTGEIARLGPAAPPPRTTSILPPPPPPPAARARIRTPELPPTNVTAAPIETEATRPSVQVPQGLVQGTERASARPPAPFADRKTVSLPPPPPRAAPRPQRDTVSLPTPDDRSFSAALHDAGLASELDENLLHAIAAHLHRRHIPTRRADLLEAYYAAGGDREVEARRIARDRFFLHKESEVATARQLVERFARLVPELPTLTLERIGGPHGPLVLRAGEAFSAVDDPHDEESAEDELDIDVEVEDPQPTVTIRGIVHALNSLLAKVEVRQRFVPLLSDDARELYVSVGVAEAVSLAQAGYLEDEDAESIIELGGW